MPTPESPYDLEERTESFALCTRWYLSDPIWKQRHDVAVQALLRSSAAVAGNCEEALETSKSGLRKRMRLVICRANIRESAMWLRHLLATRNDLSEDVIDCLQSLIEESAELSRRCTAAIRRCR